MGRDATMSTSRGAEWVLASLTPNHRSILRILIQLAVVDGKGAPTASYEALSDQCEARMIARSDADLRQHLQELSDHGIIERTLTTVIVRRDVAELQAALAAIGK